MALPPSLKSRLRLPLIAAPMFLVSGVVLGWAFWELWKLKRDKRK